MTSPAPVALGLEMTGELRPGELVVDVVLVAKVLNADGEPTLVQMASPGLRIWEAAGMAQALSDSLRSGLRDMFVEDDDE